MDTLKIKIFMLDLLFPAFCQNCEKEGSYLCQDCKEILDISEFDYCLCDKNPVRINPGEKGKCARCSDKKLSGLYSALPYKEKALTRKLIHKFKYDPSIRDLAKVFSAILIEHFVKAGTNKNDIWENAILIPVPLEIKKQKSRGFNQSEKLAEELSKILTIPVLSDELLKIKKTPPQMELSKEKRQENLKNAFSVQNTEKIKNKKIFLVDDVYTTGSTMEECANVLRTSGAKQVWGIAIARES